mgnify:CR=1 FL=1
MAYFDSPKNRVKWEIEWRSCGSRRRILQQEGFMIQVK